MITCTCSYKVKLNDYGMEELFSGSRKVLKLAERVSDLGGKVQSCTFLPKIYEIVERDGDAKIPPRDS